MICFFAILALHRNDPVVSVHAVGSVASIAKEISGQTQLPIEARGPVAEDVLIVDADQIRASELLKRIAWATYGKVVEDQGRTILVPDGDSARDAERAYRKAMDARNEEILRKVASTVLKGPFDNRAREEFKRVHADLQIPYGSISEAEYTSRLRRAAKVFGPSDRLVARVLSATSPSDWFDSTGAYITFSTSPTARQKPFNTALDRAVDLYREESAAVTGDSKPPLPIAKVSLIVSQGGLNPPGNAVACLVDAKGKVAERLLLPLNKFCTPEGPPKSILDEIPAEAEVALSQLSQQELTAWKKRDYVSLRERLQDPENHDPQESLTADVWRGTARYLHTGLVLNVPDGRLVCGPNFEPKMPNLRQSLTEFWTPGTKVDGDYIVCRPPYPRPEWGWQISRKAVANLVRDGKSGRDQLDRLSSFVASSGYLYYPYDKMAFFLLAGLPTEEQLLRMMWQFLAVYGELARDTRDAWRRGQPVRIEGAGGRLSENLDRYALAFARPVTERSYGAEQSVDPNDLLPAVVRDALLTASFRSTPMVQIRGTLKTGGESLQLTKPMYLYTLLDGAADRFASYDVRAVSNDFITFISTYRNSMRSQTEFEIGYRYAPKFGPVSDLPKEILEEAEAGRGNH